MARKALGRGLSALLGDDETRSSQEAKSFLELDIELISPNAEQPRTSFPEEELAELTQSIRMNGVVQPIIVREKNGEYQIVAGERRWRAAQRAALKQIPAVVREIDDNKMLEIALIENIQRQELNAVEESRAYKKLIDELGLTQQEVAERVGKTRTFIANYLRLVKLPKVILLLLEGNRLSVGHAKALLSIEDSRLQKSLANDILQKGLSVRDVEKAAKRTAKKSPTSKSPSAKDPNITKAETRLRRRYGTQVKILPAKSGGSGKIEIEYYGTKDLDRIYNLLMDKKSTEY